MPFRPRYHLDGHRPKTSAAMACRFWPKSQIRLTNKLARPDLAGRALRPGSHPRAFFDSVGHTTPVDPGTARSLAETVLLLSSEHTLEWRTKGPFARYAVRLTPLSSLRTCQRSQFSLFAGRENDHIDPKHLVRLDNREGVTGLRIMRAKG